MMSNQTFNNHNPNMFQSVAPRDSSSYPKDARGLPAPGFPLYGANPMQAVKMFFINYANPHGYASRSEYWYSQLFVFIFATIPMTVVVLSLFLMTGENLPSDGRVLLLLVLFWYSIFFYLATFLPTVMISIRRLTRCWLKWILLLALRPPLYRKFGSCGSHAITC